MEGKTEANLLRWVMGLVLVLLPPVLTGCGGGTPLHRYEYSQIHMGVATRLVVYAEDEAKAKAACTAAYGRVAQLEDVMSDYRPDSEVMRLCDQAGQGPVAVSPDLSRVLAEAQTLSERSGGAFDVTIGPYVKLWRAARKNRVLPTPAEVEAAGRLVGWQMVQLDERRRTVELARPGIRIDLGGIGKGYAGDAAIAVLRDHGVDRALFESGGDIVVSGPPPATRGWTIEVATAPGTTEKIELKDAAISTSGDTVQFVEIDGRRYSHVVDPRTGRALTGRTYAAVIAPRGVTSDGLSTAVGVLGPDAGRELVRKYPGVRAWIYRLETD